MALHLQGIRHLDLAVDIYVIAEVAGVRWLTDLAPDPGIVRPIHLSAGVGIGYEEAMI